MQDRNDVVARVRNREFVSNNGKVMRAFNILSVGFCRLTDARIAADEYDMSIDDFLISVNFLVKAGYLELRRIKDHLPVKVLGDAEWTALEGQWTNAGDRLGAGDITDRMVEM